MPLNRGSAVKSNAIHNRAAKQKENGNMRLANGLNFLYFVVLKNCCIIDHSHNFYKGIHTVRPRKNNPEIRNSATKFRGV